VPAARTDDDLRSRSTASRTQHAKDPTGGASGSAVLGRQPQDGVGIEPVAGAGGRPDEVGRPWSAKSDGGILVQVERRGRRAAVGGREIEGTRAVGPWFYRRPGLTIAVAAVRYEAVLVLRRVIDEPEPTTLLFCFPIALLAVAFVLRVGLLAGAAGILLVVVWVVADGAHLSFWGWVSRAAPMLLLGGLLGDAAVRLRRSEAARIRLRAAAQRHRDAVELQDAVAADTTTGHGGRRRAGR
jgi:hypothetical protein